MPTQAQRTASARSRLIKAASELVAARGSGASSVLDIGERAGLSRGAVNFHFGSKAALLEAVLVKAARSVAQAAGPPEDLAAFFRDNHRAWLAGPTRGRTIQMLFAEGLIGQTAALRAPVAELALRWRGGVAKTIADLQDRGIARKGVDADAEASLIVGSLIGLVSQGVADPDFDREAAYEAFRSTASERLDIPVEVVDDEVVDQAQPRAAR